MYQPDNYEMDHRQPSVRPPMSSSSQTEKVQFQVHDLVVEKTLKRGLEARQVSMTTHIIWSELRFCRSL